jgi:glutamate-ammonia-ligase adenylyltransferase
MEFENLISLTPYAFDAAAGTETLADFEGLGAKAKRALEGIAGSSPYLRGLLIKERPWFQMALTQIETAVPVEYARLKEVPAEVVAVELRRGKRRVALFCAVMDLCGIWPLETVTRVLTEFAEGAADIALRAALAAEVKRGKLPTITPEDDLGQLGLTVLAMGKMGAYELNYSSDTDLICLFDETRFSTDDYHDARASFIRAIKKMSASLNDITGEGYVFRTDLRLRPDPAVTPVAMPMEAAERYYESLGRTWERAAYIKARPCAGDIGAGAQFLERLTPFVWRKHLDFAAIEDAHNMRLRIREHKGLGGVISLSGHNMKLGRGGIREIEFFTQTRQLIAGGRDPDLRLRGTVEGLHALAEKGWIEAPIAERLSDHYRFHRTVEHRLQMINDAQTHDLPQSEDGFERLAMLMGRNRKDLEVELQERLEDVHSLTEAFFAASQTKPVETAPEMDNDTVTRWQSYPALRSERAGAIFERIKPEILTKLAKAARPDEALNAFDAFLKGLPAGVQLLSLFEANPQLIDLLIDVITTSPELAAYLSRNSAVFDAVIGGDFFAPWPGAAALEQEGHRVLGRVGDYEGCLDMARRWGKEWHFRIGVHFLRGLTTAEEAARQYSDLASSVLRVLWPIVVAEFERKRGPSPGRGALIVGMGSLGAELLNAQSDLDLIIIYDPHEEGGTEEGDDHSYRTYYSRLTRALVTAMTAPMAEGKLYELDMRLRPSGNKGPVATSWAAFQEYQTKEAWVWEHMALTRARPISGGASLAQEFETYRPSIFQNRDGGHVLQALSQMRARLASAKESKGAIDVRNGAGAMQDIELFSQAATLVAGGSERNVTAGLEKSVALNWISKDESLLLLEAYNAFLTLRMAAKLLGRDSIDPDDIGQGGVDFILRVTQSDGSEQLLNEMTKRRDRCAAIINAAVPEPQEDADEKA